MSVQSCIKAIIQNLPGDTAVISPGSRNAPILFALNHSKNKKKEEETEFDTISKFNYLSQIKNKDSKVSSFFLFFE